MTTRRAVVSIVVAGLGIAIGAIVLGMRMSGDPRGVWLEIAKAGAQLAAVSVIGATIAAAFKAIEGERDEERRLHEYRIGVLREVTVSYNKIKAVRRALRAYGYGPGRAGRKTAEQVAEFHIQMKALNEAQLAVERLKRELLVRRDAFEEADALSERLRTVEQYVHGVLRDWEEHGADVVVRGTPTIVRAMTQLRDFVDSSERGFEAGAAIPMDFVEERMGVQLRRRY
jgi:hypothetical protein